MSSATNVLGVVLGSLLIGCAGCAGGGSEAEESAAPPPATIEPAHLMTGLVLLHHHALLEALAAPPAAPEEWRSAEGHAALLVEAADILLRHSSGTEESWRVAAASLRAGGLETLDGIHARSLDAARSGFEHLNTACSTCHKECGAGDSPPWKS